MCRGGWEVFSTVSYYLCGILCLLMMFDILLKCLSDVQYSSLCDSFGRGIKKTKLDKEKAFMSCKNPFDELLHHWTRFDRTFSNSKSMLLDRSIDYVILCKVKITV